MWRWSEVYTSKWSCTNVEVMVGTTSSAVPRGIPGLRYNMLSHILKAPEPGGMMAHEYRDRCLILELQDPRGPRQTNYDGSSDKTVGVRGLQGPTRRARLRCQHPTWSAQ